MGASQKFIGRLIMKIYTKTGDTGLCSLASGSRVKKNSLRIEAYGTVDELNSLLGLCRARAGASLANEDLVTVDAWLSAIQHDLFNIGADLATPIDDRFEDMRLVCEQEANVMETIIDKLQAEIPSLAFFVLPAGTETGSLFHVARTVCRRAERVIVALAEHEEINPHVVPYVNRLSDFLFVMARWVQHKMGVGDVPWGKQDGLAVFYKG